MESSLSPLSPESPPSIDEIIHQALKDWKRLGKGHEAFNQFYLFRRLLRRNGGNSKLAVNQFLLDGLRLLQEKYEPEANFLQARHLDGDTVQQIANRMNVSESHLYVLQRQATTLLTETIIAHDAQAALHQRETMIERLGGELINEPIGLAAPLARLQALVTTDGPPWIIALEGIGGIGKTTLAKALLHRLIAAGQVDDIGWISAQREQLSLMGKLERNPQPVMNAEQMMAALAHQLIPNAAPERYEQALRSRLKDLPHIIVIDNLETVIDIETLLPTLQKLANPSKFIVTARENLFGIANLYHDKVAELSSCHALQLIRHEAALRGLPVLAMSSDAELLPIVETVGGNPLALRLVVGQTHIYGLQSILYDLRQARSQPATNLYTYIYQKAWAKLDPLERKALLVMPFAGPDGDDLGYLAEVGDLDLDDLRTALNQLVTLNLVDARGGLNDRRYAIHNLTRTFLLEQVVRWLGK
ncbi:MAG: hypothetical protein DYG89_40865 [Caldilinea sp. CFX5]|nr:hypothetical protein [Caldilinea sp. CFX5]